MSDDLNVLTDEEKKHMSYRLCVLGTGALGATFGSIAGGQTLLGAAGGTVFGLFSCKLVAEPLKRKLFSQNTLLTEPEFKLVLAGAKRQFPFATKLQLLELMANARMESRRAPTKYQC